jgi:hypothetical protein
LVSQELVKYVFDGDLSTKIEVIKFSTNPREVVTVGEMLEQGGESNE